MHHSISPAVGDFRDFRFCSLNHQRDASDSSHPHSSYPLPSHHLFLRIIIYSSYHFYHHIFCCGIARTFINHHIISLNAFISSSILAHHPAQLHHCYWLRKTKLTVALSVMCKTYRTVGPVYKSVGDESVKWLRVRQAVRPSPLSVWDVWFDATVLTQIPISHLT